MEVELDVTCLKVPSNQRSVMPTSVDELIDIVICDTHYVIKMPTLYNICAYPF
jgi:hypothetical protein